MDSTGYISVEGGNVWYSIVGAGKAGIPLLTLHGGPGYPHDYLKPLEQLSDERPVILYDQLGCGKSDRPPNRALWRVEPGEIGDGLRERPAQTRSGVMIYSALFGIGKIVLKEVAPGIAFLAVAAV